MINIKVDNSSTTEHKKYILNMNVMLIIKYSFNAMQNMRKLCKCNARIFFYLFYKMCCATTE